ncbi:predicted protein [Naegleria gruberi]|uniref:Predicted protein n=1 Tax=Naegleria gruberi TaxID=5762 RepID=D2VB42_NAEGR|nr:uncharacterized protein NAEGRDRAFT_66081 [Naegleria gruberi]EFC46059.1 predicted protein [Naegleria gruberi]|eukprot:XP_002678803.1 predicted protein [Naegleria gruberi strain NEG-M]
MIISCTIPVFFLQQVDNSNSKNNIKEIGDADLHKCLKNQKWNGLFLKYSEQCFACEDIMFWNAVEQFKSVTAERLKRELFYNIYRTYIRIGAPLELNIARREFGIPEIESQFNVLCKQVSYHHETLSVVGKSNNNNNNNNHQMGMSKSRYVDLSSSENISVRSDIFDQVQLGCEHNMRDNFYRFNLTHSEMSAKLVRRGLVHNDDNEGVLFNPVE